MPDLESQIFSVALILFLMIGSAKLIIEQLTALVIQFKKLKATIESEYSVETGKLEVRPRAEHDGTSNPTAAPAALHSPSECGLEVPQS